MHLQKISILNATLKSSRKIQIVKKMSYSSFLWEKSTQLHNQYRSELIKLISKGEEEFATK